MTQSTNPGEAAPGEATAEPTPAPTNGGIPDDAEEFARLPASPRRRPAASAIVLILGGFIAFHLRTDIQYAFSKHTAVELGDARTLQTRGVALDDNRYVHLSGQPDRRNSLYLEPRGDQHRQTFFRLLGAGGQVLVRALDTSERADVADSWSGRLRRVDQLPYAPSLREHYEKKVTARRYLAPDVFKQVLGGTSAVRDRAGEPLTLGADVVFSLDWNRSGRLRVLLPKDKFAAAADAQKEVERLGLSVEPDYATVDAYAVTVAAPLAERNSVIAKLDTLAENSQLVWQAADLRLVATRGQLHATEAGVQMTDGAAITSDAASHKPSILPLVVPWAELSAASVEEAVKLPADAFILTEGEDPSAVWWAPAVAALLLGLMLWNAAYLVRGRRA